MLFELYMMKCVTAAKDRQQCKIHFFGFLYKDRHKVKYNTHPSSYFLECYICNNCYDIAGRT